MAEKEKKDESASDLKWYVVQTFTGWENRVKTNIEHVLLREGLAHKLGRVYIPQKRYIDTKGGKKRELMRNVMPGYVFILMEPDEEVFALVQKIQGVSTFLGEDGKPTAIPLNEIQSILELGEERGERPKAAINFHVGDQVKVVEGPFQNFVATIEQIDEERGRLKVAVSIFGRETSVELDVTQVEAV
ncbi:MAG: transcription termination/antitermination protein NusG [Candidatus Sumerlaea chitinivorans]|uniref:Transcription termination/antitermination protein NusG n=1 Tax=Sumerlaea chitinivorans TaxID=2250252 RepID=A0A2Z4Y447_SUMC1|nr:Transcription antitermination protein NusG [Candidatus Sumerlaea chitinivorans]MCX7964614.1 transcription termination/antitermination protein NusG [Candidatus Sumerlaea chitinivorans]